MATDNFTIPNKPFYFYPNRIDDLNIDITSLRAAGLRFICASHGNATANAPSIVISGDTKDNSGYTMTFIWDSGDYALQIAWIQATKAIYRRTYNYPNLGQWSTWDQVWLTS